MTTYRVIFERIGRSHNVPDLITEARDSDHLAEQVYDYARPYLASQDVEVVVDGDRGFISCGFASGGRFTVTEAVSA